MGKKGKNKKGKGKKYKIKKVNGVRFYRPELVFTQSLMELLCEYQSKYTNLFNLSKEYDHKLLDAIACEIYQRFTHLINGFQGQLSCQSFTHDYRRAYPHCDDLKLIQQKVQDITEQLGQPLTDIDVEKLILADAGNSVDSKVGVGELLVSSCSILMPIALKIESHIKNLNTSESGPNKLIREALKKQINCIQELLTESINETVLPDMKNESYGKMRIYGEPYLPTAGILNSFIARFSPSNVMMSRRMYNCLLLNVPTHQIDAFMKMDQTVLANVKLFCRHSFTPEYRIPAFIVQKIKEFFGIGVAASIGLDEEGAEDEMEGAEDEMEGRQDGEGSDDSDE